MKLLDIRVSGSLLLFLGMTAALAFGQSAKPSDAKSQVKTVDEKEFAFIGISARTSNSKEMSGTGAIPQQWQRFFTEGWMEKIPNRADGKLIALYTDFVQGQDLQYTFLIGARVKPGTAAPEGMVAKTIPAGKYAVITSDRGVPQEVVPRVWQKIWTMPKSELGGDRAFQADYELYNEGELNPESLQAEVHIGLK